MKKTDGYEKGKGTHQDLYEAIKEKYIPNSGYPSLCCYKKNIAEAVAMVYFMTEIQYEFQNPNHVYDEIEDVLEPNIVEESLANIHPRNLSNKVGRCKVSMSVKCVA